MADVMTKTQRSRCMSRIRGRNTGPEMRVRKVLWRMGYRYFVKTRLPGRPDIVFPRLHIAIFIDGCFWHRCPLHYQEPASNAKWWDTKINRNVARDVSVNSELEDAGWKVLRFWEHQIRSSPELVARRIARRVDTARCQTGSRRKLSNSRGSSSKI